MIVDDAALTSSRPATSITAFVASGALAGALSALTFCLVHQLLISAIWFATVGMLFAGAISGACIAWSYALVVKNRTVRSWFRYNMVYVIILVVLGIVSLAVFEPVTTIAELLKSNKPPRALIGQALPVTILFTVCSAGLLILLNRPGWLGGVAILVTTLVIVLFLGLNISILGLVFIAKSSLYVIWEVVALIVVLALVYAVAMAYLWRVALRPNEHEQPGR
jgi:hypothetical protein